MPVSAGELYAWHARDGAFARLAPPWDDVRVASQQGDFATRRVELALRLGPLPLRWVAQHRDHVAGEQFVDEQVRGPFSRWVHTHRFIADGPASVLEDSLDIRGPLGLPVPRSMLDRMFRFRHERTRDDLRRHHAFAEQPRRRVAITGASGLVGSALSAFLTTGGHAVVPLVRSGEGTRWSPLEGEALPDGLDGADAVVHLAGENIGQGRWTAARKRTIRESRVAATRRLAVALASLPRPPSVLVVASAVGFYGDRGDEELTEDSQQGQGFLAELCADWEAAAQPAVEAGIRVVHLRIGVVMSASGGALPKMRAPFLAGVGGPLGSGRQHVSWIALDDLVGLAHHALMTDLVGVVNATAPQPVTAAEQARTLGAVLHRPALIPVPAFALELLFGEMGRELLLAGARVLPQRALDAGFEFLHPNLESALRGELGKWS
jgi:uncharacterized protein (TIGR01777 family)